jgi:hypothetical protein
MDVKHLPAGFAQDKLMDVVELLKARKTCGPAQLSALSSWLKTLPDPSSRTVDRIGKLTVP